MVGRCSTEDNPYGEEKDITLCPWTGLQAPVISLLLFGRRTALHLKQKRVLYTQTTGFLYMESPRESESSKDRGRYKSCKKKERVLTPLNWPLLYYYLGGTEICI